MHDERWSREVLPGFIVFEGLDGAGTTTQAKHLVDLYGGSREAVFTWEPTAFATGRVIRELLSGPEQVQPETLALLFAADRSEHLNRPGEGIRALLAEGKVVVCDRYLFSSLAYQGALADRELVERLNAPFPLPAHLVFIDTPLEEAYRRMETRQTLDRKSGDALEQRSVQEQVAPRYRAVLEMFSRCDAVRRGAMKIHRIDGSLPREEVLQAILEALGPDAPRT